MKNFILLYIIIISSIKLFAQTENGNNDFIVYPYLQNMTDSSICVMWETSYPTQGELWLVKTTLHNIDPKLKLAAKENVGNTLHRLCATGLIPGETYFYQVKNVSPKGDTTKGEITNFIVPDYNKAPVSFAVVGDNQGHNDCWKRISEQINQECPSFIVHCGDLVHYGKNKDDWTDELFEPAKNLLNHVPMYPTIGNHEMNDEKYYQYFNLPYNDAFYTIKKGDLRIIFVDTNKDILEGSFRYQRLEQTLANCKEKWIVVVHHQPPYTSNNYAYKSTLASKSTKGDPNTLQLRSLYEMYGVDVVFSGHVHGYERSYPIFKNHIDNKIGVVYIISGGGGGRFQPQSTYKEWFSEEVKTINHYLNVNISENKLTVEAIDTTGCIFDTWTKEKTNNNQKLNAPLIKTSQSYFTDSTKVTIKNTNNIGVINFRINDKENYTTNTKDTSLIIDETSTISASISNCEIASREVTKIVSKLPLMEKQSKVSNLINAEYFEGEFSMLPDFGKLKPTKYFILDTLSLDPITPRIKDHFAVRFTGSFSIPETNIYRFVLESYDGSKLIIDGKEIINNDGVHYEILRDGYAALEKGQHTIELDYFDFTRRETLLLKIGKENEKIVSINNYINIEK